MLDRMIRRSELLRLVDELALSRRIVGPIRKGERFVYQQVARAEQLDLDFNYCVYSPKAWLLPPRETLFTYSRTDGAFKAEPRFDDSPTAVIGVHPCDINAIRMLDKVFDEREPDEHYLCRRRNLFIVGIDCAQPCTTGVFCKNMKANSAASGFDIMCHPVARLADGDVRYAAVFGTQGGREWVLYARAGEAPSADDERAFARYHANKDRMFPAVMTEDVDSLPNLLDRSYDSLLWEATARRCYSCGSCNLVCPTCYCFNMRDECDATLSNGERVREWDGCQLTGFAAVAGGHNFRTKPAARLRHRIYRKAKWILERTGIPGCVGCARCDRACTAKIHSLEIYRQLAEEV